jgi:Cu2+-exporting ATPase
MLAGAGALARSGVLVRRLQALEALAAVDTLVFDKTGTLTRDAMVLGSVQTRSETTRAQVLAQAAALAQHSLHPVSRALCAAALSSDTMLMTPRWTCNGVTEFSGQGVLGEVRALNGSEAVKMMRLGSAAFCSGPNAPHNGMQAMLADAKGWLATFELTEDLRPDASIAVSSLRSEKLDVQMLSGDSTQAVARVAAQAGIAVARGGCTPADKLVVLKELQAQGHSVAMVGDGLNDGPVLAGANVSFAFGPAVPLAQAQADFVVLGGNLMSVVHALRLARRTMSVVRQNLWWALGYNAACIPLAVVGWLPAWAAGLGMATSSLLVVLNALRLARNISMESGR